MTSAEGRVYGLMRRVAYARAGGLCELCTTWVDEKYYVVHHIMHQGPVKHMRLDLDNVLVLCTTCHDLDLTGELVGLIKQKIGETQYYELKRRAQKTGREGLDSIRARLERELEEVGSGG